MYRFDVTVRKSENGRMAEYKNKRTTVIVDSPSSKEYKFEKLSAFSLLS